MRIWTRKDSKRFEEIWKRGGKTQEGINLEVILQDIKEDNEEKLILDSQTPMVINPNFLHFELEEENKLSLNLTNYETFLRECKRAELLHEREISLIMKNKDFNRDNAQEWVLCWQEIANYESKKQVWEDEICPFSELIEMNRKVTEEAEEHAKEKINKITKAKQGTKFEIAIEDKAKEIPNWEDIRERASYTKTVLIDKEIAKEQQYLFPSSKGIEKISERAGNGEKYIVSEKDFGNKKVKYYQTIPEGVNEPRFSRNTYKTYLIINRYAFVEETLTPMILKEDLVKEVGDYAKCYKEVDGYLDYLVMSTYVIEDKKNRTREIGHLVNHIKQVNVGKKGSHYFIELNPHHHKTLKAITQDKKGKELPPYVKIPTDKILTYQGRKKGIDNFLMAHKGLKTIYPISIRTLLIKGLGLSEIEIRKEGLPYLAKELDKGLREAKEWNWNIEDKSLKTLENYNKLVHYDFSKIHQEGFRGLVRYYKEADKLKKDTKDTKLKNRWSLSKTIFLKTKLIFTSKKNLF